MKRSTDDVYFDRDIYPEYQRKMVVDTWLYGRSQTSTTAENLFNVDASDGFWNNFLGGGVVVGDILGWAWRNTVGRLGDYDFTSGGQNHNFKTTARKMTISRLRQSLEQLYVGNLVVYGDPSIKPHDFISIHDEITNMNGPATARDIVHTLSFETGFVTTITPDAIVDPISDVESKRKTVANCAAAIGYMAHIQTLKNLWNSELVQTIATFVSEFSTQKFLEFRRKYATTLNQKFNARYRYLSRVNQVDGMAQARIRNLDKKIASVEEEITKLRRDNYKAEEIGGYFEKIQNKRADIDKLKIDLKQAETDRFSKYATEHQRIQQEIKYIEQEHRALLSQVHLDPKYKFAADKKYAELLATKQQLNDLLLDYANGVFEGTEIQRIEAEIKAAKKDLYKLSKQIPDELREYHNELKKQGKKMTPAEIRVYRDKQIKAAAEIKQKQEKIKLLNQSKQRAEAARDSVKAGKYTPFKNFLAKRFKAISEQAAVWEKNLEALELAKVTFIHEFYSATNTKYNEKYKELTNLFDSLESKDKFISDKATLDLLDNYLKDPASDPAIVKELNDNWAKIDTIRTDAQNASKSLDTLTKDSAEIQNMLAEYSKTGNISPIQPSSIEITQSAYLSDYEKISTELDDLRKIPRATRTQDQINRINVLQGKMDDLKLAYEAKIGKPFNVTDAKAALDKLQKTLSPEDFARAEKEIEAFRLQITMFESELRHGDPAAVNKMIAKLLKEKYFANQTQIVKLKDTILNLANYNKWDFIQSLEKLPPDIKEKIFASLKGKFDDADKVVKAIEQILQDESDIYKALQRLEASEESISVFNQMTKEYGALRVVFQKYNLIDNLGAFEKIIYAIFKTMSTALKIINVLVETIGKIPIIGRIFKFLGSTTVGAIMFMFEMGGIDAKAFLDNYKTLQITPLSKNGIAFIPFMGGSMGTIVGTPNFKRKGPLFEFITPYFSSDENVASNHPIAHFTGSFVQILLMTDFSKAVDTVNQNIGVQYPASGYKTGATASVMNSFFTRQPIKSYHQLLGPKYPGQSNDTRSAEEKKDDIDMLKVKVLPFKHAWNPNGYTQNALDPLIYVPDSDYYQFKQNNFFISRFEKLDTEDITNAETINLSLGKRTEAVTCIRINESKDKERDAPLIHPYANAILLDIINFCYMQLSYKDKLDRNDFLNKVSNDYITYSSGYKFNGQNVYTSSGFGFTLIPHGESVQNIKIKLNEYKRKSILDYQEQDSKFTINVLIPRDL